MYSNTRLLPYVLNYAGAHNQFSLTKKPSRSKKWDDNERPLKNVAAHHYRIVRGGHGDWYDLVLYQTVMARFYKPDAQGHERRLYMGHWSQTSKAFMQDVLGMYTTSFMPVHQDGVGTINWHNREHKVAVFIGEGRSIGNDRGMDYSADLWFDEHGVLIIDKSEALEARRFLSSTQDKHKRKEIRALFEGYATLMALRLPEFLNPNTPIGRQDTYAFAKINADDRTLLDFVNTVVNGEQPSEAHIDALVKYTANAVEALASKRAQDFVSLPYTDLCIKNIPNLSIDDLKISEKDVIQSVVNKLLRVSGAANPSERVVYPSFRPAVDLPRSNLFV